MFGNKSFFLALKISIIYIIAGCIWIFMSDTITHYLSSEIKDFFYIELTKGLLFIFTTGLLLFFYIYKQTNRFLVFENEYKLLFKNHKSVMLIIDPDTGFIIDANKSAENFYGYTLDEMKGKKIWDINMLPESEVREEIEKAINENKNFFQFKHKLKNGEIRDVEVYCSPTKIYNKTYLYAIINDITEKIKTEEDINNLLNQYKTACQNLANFIDYSPLPIVAVDKNGIVTIWNSSAEKVFGWKREEVIGKFYPIVPIERKEEFKNYINQILNKEVLKGIEVERINKEGKFLTLRAFVSPMYDADGNVSNIVAILEDITEKKKLDKEILHMKKMESIGKLAAGISHDFNNMLTAIIGFASLLELKTRENQELNHYAKQILMVSERATNLTKALLTYSRKHPFSPRKLNLNDLIKSSIGFLEKIISENIKIKLILNENIKDIYADPYQIEQIFLNLLTNAKDAMPNGGIVYIETSNSVIDEEFVKAHQYGKTGNYVKLSVTDTGLGIPPEIKDKIFDPFFSTKEQGKGTGLGLSIVYGIVKQHNGYITLYSEVHKGTTFNIYFPVFEDENEKDTEINNTFNSLYNKNLHILIVDDDITVLESIKSFLVNLGCKVLTANNGYTALQLFQENIPTINLAQNCH